MYFTDKTDFLAHYGVMGMKWGHRKQKDLYKKIKKAGKTGNKDLINKYLNENIDKSTKKRLASLKNEIKSLNKKHDKISNKEMKKIAKEKVLSLNDKHDLRIIDKELGKNKEITSLHNETDRAISERKETIKKIKKELLGRYGNRYIKSLNTKTGKSYAIKAKDYLSFL